MTAQSRPSPEQVIHVHPVPASGPFQFTLAQQTARKCQNATGSASGSLRYFSSIQYGSAHGLVSPCTPERLQSPLFRHVDLHKTDPPLGWTLSGSDFRICVARIFVHCPNLVPLFPTKTHYTTRHVIPTVPSMKPRFLQRLNRTGGICSAAASDRDIQDRQQCPVH